MIEAVVRSKGLKSLAKELGFRNLSNAVVLGTDSNAAKRFVCRRGLGKMRHIEIRDLWLQKEVREGKLKVVKVMGRENPADLMTKILTISEVEERLRGLNITIVRKEDGAARKLTGRGEDDDDDDHEPCLLALFVQDCEEEMAYRGDSEAVHPPGLGNGIPFEGGGASFIGTDTIIDRSLGPVAVGSKVIQKGRGYPSIQQLVFAACSTNCTGDGGVSTYDIST